MSMLAEVLRVTMAAIAKGLNVSTMTVYRRIRKAGISLDGLRDSNGEITAAGASVIASLFDAPQSATQGITGDETRYNDDVPQSITGGATAEDEAQVSILTAKLDAANDTIKRLEAERDRLTAQLDAVTAALEREQMDRANERLLLTGGNHAQQRRGGLFGWLHRDKF